MKSKLINYKKEQWQKKRKWILSRDKYRDQELWRYGIYCEANTVHHIFPVEFYPELKYEDWNLISLSKATHNKMHERTSHNLTELGLELQRRKRNEYLDWCKLNGYEPHFDN